MRKKIAAVPLISMLIAAFFWSTALAAGDQESPSLESLARTVLTGGPDEAAEAEATLREAGPAGMDAMLAAGASGDVLDRVCGVHDCADIRLFWYTDLEAAKAAAHASGKPILSLRLMGKLDEEFSCANSRFFRTVFYNNREINALLRDRFILHWRSVRPVPRVTIDFGDGSRVERTLTGNSIHYVLDSRGRLVEALPGLYGPKEFQAALEEAAQQARSAERIDDAQFADWLRTLSELRLTERASMLARERARATRDPGAALPSTGILLGRPTISADPTSSKSSSEAPTLWMITNRGRSRARQAAPKPAAVPSMPPLLSNVTDDLLATLGEIHRDGVHLDAESRAFLLRKQGVTDPQAADRLVDSFEKTVALDEVIDDYRTGPAILVKLSDPATLKDFDLEDFNLWVYEQVFRTPLSDPWLGLAPDDVYGALPAAARTEAPRPTG